MSRTTQTHESYQSKSCCICYNHKQFLTAGVNTRLCFSLEFPLCVCVDIKHVLVCIPWRHFFNEVFLQKKKKKGKEKSVHFPEEFFCFHAMRRYIQSQGITSWRCLSSATSRPPPPPVGRPGASPPRPEKAVRWEMSEVLLLLRCTRDSSAWSPGCSTARSLAGRRASAAVGVAGTRCPRILETGRWEWSLEPLIRKDSEQSCVYPTTLPPAPGSAAPPWWRWRHSFRYPTPTDGGSPHTVEPAVYRCHRPSPWWTPAPGARCWVHGWRTAPVVASHGTPPLRSSWKRRHTRGEAAATLPLSYS